MQLTDVRARSLPPEAVLATATVPTPHENFLQTRVFGSLDGLRALCALWVVKGHIEWNTGIRIFDTPGLGVEMFFVISGFLIVTLLLRERQKTGSIKLRNFYMRRILRIFPIYYVSILLVLSATLFLALEHRPGALRFYGPAFIVLLTYTQNIIPVSLGSFHPCWSLAIEEQFYLGWPTIEKSVSTSTRWLILLGIILISELVSFGIFNRAIVRLYGDPQAITMPLFLVTFAPLAFGVCLAHFLHDPRTYRLAFRALGYRWAPLFWIGILALVFRFTPADATGWSRLAVHSTLALLLGSLVIREDHFAASFFRFSVLARIGAISYGLYLYHQWIIDYVGRLLDRLVQRLGAPPMSSFSRLMAIGTLCIIVADLSFRFFEEPILRLRSRFRS
jgi:peptidoglycan/LPS O-acetylase OafA/YrhL